MALFQEEYLYPVAGENQVAVTEPPHWLLLFPLVEMESWDFPGTPVVKTLCFSCKGHRFDPWSGD